MFSNGYLRKKCQGEKRNIQTSFKEKTTEGRRAVPIKYMIQKFNKTIFGKLT